MILPISPKTDKLSRNYSKSRVNDIARVRCDKGYVLEESGGKNQTVACVIDDKERPVWMDNDTLLEPQKCVKGSLTKSVGNIRVVISLLKCCQHFWSDCSSFYSKLFIDISKCVGMVGRLIASRSTTATRGQETAIFKRVFDTVHHLCFYPHSIIQCESEILPAPA